MLLKELSGTSDHNRFFPLFRTDPHTVMAVPWKESPAEFEMTR
jgi:hypothetical protein